MHYISGTCELEKNIFSCSGWAGHAGRRSLGTNYYEFEVLIIVCSGEYIKFLVGELPAVLQGGKQGITIAEKYVSSGSFYEY